MFLDGSADELRGKSEVLVDEAYDFGEAGSAAKVRYDNEDDIQVLEQEIESVVSVTDEIEGGFTPRIAQASVDDKVATIDEVKSLHNFRKGGFTGEGVNVVVMDSGIDESHELFADMDITHADVTGWGEGDDVGHGTAVAGQIVRLAPDVNLTSLRIFGGEGSASMDTILKAYEWLFAHTDEMDIVNMSWGASQKVQELDDLQNQLVEQGVRDVTAAGNTSEEGGSPATAEKAFSAGACTQEGEMASFSSYNPNWDNPDVTAIGVNNRLAQASDTTMGDNLTGPWTMASGTSFAAPELTGSVARYYEEYGSENIETAYEESADDIKGIEKDGSGLLNHNAAVNLPQANATVWTLWGDGQDIIYLNKNWLTDGDYDVSKVNESDDRITLEFIKE